MPQFVLYVPFKLFIYKAKITKKRLFKVNRRDFNIDKVEATFIRELKAVITNKSYKLNKISIVVRSSLGRGRVIPYNIEDFSIA